MVYDVSLEELKKLKAAATQQLEMLNEQIEKCERTEEKLKTLKDIEKLYDLGGEILIRDGDEFNRTIIVSKAKENRKAFLNHLKQEAIKWIKDEKQGYPDIYNTVDDLKAIRRFIKHFFNISEKDLLQ